MLTKISFLTDWKLTGSVGRDQKVINGTFAVELLLLLFFSFSSFYGLNF